MNMSGHYSREFYQPFGPPNPPFIPPQVFRHQQYPSFLRNFSPYPPNYPPQPQYFAEYSLWGSSSYNRLDPAELIHAHDPAPMIEPPRFSDQFCHALELVPPDPNIKPDSVIEEKPKLSNSEVTEKKVISKEDFLRHPDAQNGEYDDRIDSEQSSNSSGSTIGDWTQSSFHRSGKCPPYPWGGRSARGAATRGRKAMQRRLVKALSQPVRMDKAASMMARMGWMGGGLGRDGNGIVDPIEPNADYASNHIGFGVASMQPTPKLTRRQLRLSKAKSNKERFKTNMLLHILDFVKNDLLIELYFDNKLPSCQRKKIHRLVGGLANREEKIDLDCTFQQEIVNDIHRRNKYELCTQSEGEGTERQICVYKSAPSNIFLVTPEDCRPCNTDIKEIEEDSNPFLKSITKHIKEDPGTVLRPTPPHLIDKLIEFFIDFSQEDVYKEFRFLGPFTEKEIFVINNFLALVNDIENQQKPFCQVPVELLDVFTQNNSFKADSDPNGFTSIRKVYFNLKAEFEKEQDILDIMESY